MTTTKKTSEPMAAESIVDMLTTVVQEIDLWGKLAQDRIDRRAEREHQEKATKSAQWRKVTFYLPHETVRMLRIRAAKEERDMSDVIADAAARYLQQ